MRGKRNEPANVVATARVVAAAARRLLRAAGAHGRGQRPRALRLVAGPWSGSARTSSPIPTCSTRSSATRSWRPADVVLEVGAGEGVLTERLAAVAAHVHTVEIDRGLEPALAAIAALPNVSLHWGDAMKLDLAGLEPAPTAMVANLPYSVATPLILRTIEQLPSLATLDGDGPARDRRPPAGGAGQPHLRLAERGRPARLRGRAGAQGRPRRLQAAPAGRLGDPAACAAPGPPPTRRPAPWSAPPSPTAASRSPARSSTARRARWRRPGRRSPSWAWPRTRAPRRSRRRSSPPCPRSCRQTPDRRPAAAMLLHAPAKLNLCLYLGPRRADGLHELCSLFEPLALADLIEVSEAERDEVICPGVEGENLAARALAALRERGWRRAAAAGRDREAGPGRRRPRRRQRRRRRGPAPRRAERVDDPARARRRARRRRPLTAGAGAGPGPRRRRAGRAAAGADPARGGAAARRRWPQHRRRSSPRPTGSALGRRAGGAGGAGRAPARRGRRRRLAALLPRAARQRPRAAPARSLRPAIGDALDELREAGAPVALLSGSGPTAVGLFADLAAARSAADE